jgi:uncharacterized damage-inducible protein DinB
MDPQVARLAALFDLNTDLLLNCLDGLTDAEAQRRLEAGGNSVTFLAGHLTDSRHFLVTRLGTRSPIRWHDTWRMFGVSRKSVSLPLLEEIRPAWEAVSTHLRAVLSELSADELAQPNVHRFPLEDSSRLGMIAYLVQHDSYHLGQIVHSPATGQASDVLRSAA